METKRMMDDSNFTGYTLLFLIGIFGFFLSKSHLKPLFVPRFRNWSVANIAAASAGAIIVVCVAASSDSVSRVNSTGDATAMAMWVSLLFSFYKFGLHDLLRMSREAAWKIHYAFGIFTILMGMFHAGIVFRRLGNNVFHELLAVFGLVGLILMILGVVPALFVRYDRWKSLHFLSFLGLLFTIYHAVVEAFKRKTPVTITTAILNSTAVLAYLGQKIYTHVATKYAVVQKSEVSVEPRSSHVFLDLSIPGFAFQAGQWGRLRVPSLSSVAHPFTLVPGRDGATVSLCIKVGGKFTSQLAECCQVGKPPAMCLQGPYGCPCQPAKETQRAVFVLGGVGITPALSLATREHTSGRQVDLFWALRSEALLQYAAPFLELCLSSRSCVHLRGKAFGEDRPLPLHARHGSKELRAWLAELGKSYADGVSAASIFVCGPENMVREVKQFLLEDASFTQWSLHVEEFHFLPQIPSRGAPSNHAETKLADKEGDVAVAV
ncbi:tmoF [Symbiodinium sp. CCMP2592]|nr:tmoF [Symbiodinium sp. CCMP2592]